MFLLVPFIRAATQINDLKTFNLRTSSSEVIELSPELVYAIGLHDKSDLYKIQYSPSNEAELQELNVNNKQRFIVIGNKLIVSSKNESKSLNFSITSFESGVCQQYAYAFDFKNRIYFNVSIQSSTTQFCIFPEMPGKFSVKTSQAEGVKQFIAYQSNSKIQERNNLDENFTSEAAFSTLYFPYNTTAKTISYEMTYNKANDMSSNCKYYQIPVFDRSYTETTQEHNYLKISNIGCISIPDYETPKDYQIYYIIGFSCGGVLIIALIIIAAVAITRRRRKRHAESTAATPLI